MQELTKLTDRGNSGQNTDHLRRVVWVLTGKGQEDAFWGYGYDLYLTLGGVYVGVYLCENSSSSTCKIRALYHM